MGQTVSDHCNSAARSSLSLSRLLYAVDFQHVCISYPGWVQWYLSAACISLLCGGGHCLSLYRLHSLRLFAKHTVQPAVARCSGCIQRQVWP